METDGFPATGYGTWRQFRRRVRARNARGKNMVLGAQCRACAVEDWVCDNCAEPHDAWAALHVNTVGISLGEVRSVSEMALGVAAR